MVSDELISVVVCYANSNHQDLIPVKLPPNTSVLTAIQQSGILDKYKEIYLEHNKVGIFGQLVKLDQTLHDNDRIEIYRPLQIDPMEARRHRAARQNN